MRKVDSRQIQSLLGNAFYWRCHDFFLDFFNRQCEYKILMTRRCFSLFKIFAPILKEEGYENKHGVIITDRAIPFYASKIARAIRFSTEHSIAVILADDIIIYGRTVSTILKQLEGMCSLNTKDFTRHVRVSCIVMNQEDSKLDPQYRDVVFAKQVVSAGMLRRYSNSIADLISNEPIANTCYIVSYFRQNNGADKKDTLTLYTADVKKVSKFADLISSATIRERTHEAITVVTPLIVLKPFSISKYKSAFMEFFGEWACVAELLQSDNQELSQPKQQYLSLLLSHALLRAYLEEKGEHFELCKTDYYDTIGYNFTSDFRDEFAKIDITNSFDMFSNFQLCNDLSDCQDLRTAVFTQSVIDNHSENISAVQYNSDLDLSAYPHRSFFTLFQLIDSGRATIKPFFDEKKPNIQNLFVCG